MSDSRAEHLEQRIEVLRAELAGLRSGILPLIEAQNGSAGRGATVASMADVLGMSRPAVNNHCKRMARAGLIDRVPLTVDGGGLAYAYRRRHG